MQPLPTTTRGICTSEKEPTRGLFPMQVFPLHTLPVVDHHQLLLQPSDASSSLSASPWSSDSECEPKEMELEQKSITTTFTQQQQQELTTTKNLSSEFECTTFSNNVSKIKDPYWRPPTTTSASSLVYSRSSTMTEDTTETTEGCADADADDESMWSSVEGTNRRRLSSISTVGSILLHQHPLLQDPKDESDLSLSQVSPTGVQQECWQAATAALMLSEGQLCPIIALQDGADDDDECCEDDEACEDNHCGDRLGHESYHHHQSSSRGNGGPSSSGRGSKLFRRSKSLDADKDFRMVVVDDSLPKRSRRWTSWEPAEPPTIRTDDPEERALRNRRYLCESTVQQLYEERKDHILELFSDTWLLTDDLGDDIV